MHAMHIKIILAVSSTFAILIGPIQSIIRTKVFVTIVCKQLIEFMISILAFRCILTMIRAGIRFELALCSIAGCLI